MPKKKTKVQVFKVGDRVQFKYNTYLKGHPLVNKTGTIHQIFSTVFSNWNCSVNFDQEDGKVICNPIACNFDELELIPIKKSSKKVNKKGKQSEKY